MIPALLLCCLIGSEGDPPLPKQRLLVYLWDYEENRNPETVTSLPRFRNSRFVRKALTDPAYAELQDILRSIADVQIIDDYRIVDQLPCPCYSFTRYEEAVEIGNAWPVDEYGTRGMLYIDHVGMLGHLTFLAGMARAQHMDEDVLAYAFESRHGSREDGNWKTTFKMTSTEYGPTVTPYPPIRYDPEIKLAYSETTSLSVGGVLIETEGRTAHQTTHGDTDPLLFLSQMDMGTDLLTPRIRALVERYYPEGDFPFFVVGGAYDIPLVHRGTIPGVCSGREGSVVTFQSEGTQVTVDLLRSSTTITRPRGGGTKFGIPGTWTKAVEVNRRIHQTSRMP